MPTLYLVRHGRAAAGWDADQDPALDQQGRQQATRMTDGLAPKGPMDLVVSPMARTRETAEPLAEAWQVQARIEPRVSEIPSPVNDLAARGEWLRSVAVREWGELDETLLQWRAGIVEALLESDRDTVIVSHFIAINAAVGVAIGDDSVVHFRPDYCSVTVLQSVGDRLRLVRLGTEAETRVL